MTPRWMQRPAGEIRRLAREECGVALMLTLAVFLLLYILCCGVYAVGETVRQRIELQNACDAAAYSAAVVQADALSRMAVVNRAMAWTYIQLCREQMDYIVYSWLKLTYDRFWWDKEHKAVLGKIGDKRHYTFKDYYLDFGAYGAGLRHYGSDKHKNWWYIGVGDGSTVKRDHVFLNGETDFSKATPVADIEGIVGGLNEWSIAAYGKEWKAMMKERILEHRTQILSMNATLADINRRMKDSLQDTIEYALFHNLPKDAEGKMSVADAEDFYWAALGGAGPMPEAYSGILKPEDGEDPSGSYFSGLGNTEGDEIQFLTMADGIPGRRAGAPGWMGSREVRLSDYFGFGQDDGLTQTDSDGSKVYVAGGLDQWYVRATEEEATSGNLSVEKGFRNPPGGIMRAYKHSNREEGSEMKFGLEFLRPNHIFSWKPGLSRIFGAGDVSGSFGRFGNPFAGGVNSRARGVANQILQMATQVLQGVIGNLGGVIGQLGGLEKFSADIPSSNEHDPDDFPDQCLHVSPSRGLVAEYEWASAYWMCPWVKWTDWTGVHLKRFGCFRLPVSALIGCDAHGYKPWVSKELEVLRPRQGNKAGARRAEYRSCFINFDDTQNAEKNQYLKGYARVYGDDEEIFDEWCYVGTPACPWVLSKAFFRGDGTILVGLARKQRNPFLRLAGGVGKGGIYEPFSPQTGADRYLVALSAGRAAWAPRPDKPVTGMESMNGTGRPKPPGNYEPRFDGVTEHVFGFGCVCGEPETQDRLLRMWNLSQTDWDATLLPLRHAYDDHSPYDSYVNLKDGSFWEYQDDVTNAVQKLAARVESMTWSSGLLLMGAAQVSGGAELAEKIRGSRPLRTSEIMAFPEATEPGGRGRGSRYKMFLHRRIL